MQNMNLIKRFILIGAVAVAGCGSDDSTCGDGGCPDSGALGADTGTAGDTAMQWGLSDMTNNFTITKVQVTSDGCNLGPAVLMGMARPVTYNRTTATISIGDLKGTPPMPSWGTGMAAGNSATLTRDNTAGDGAACTWHQKDVSLLNLFNHDKFTLDVTEDEDTFMGCTTPAPPASGKCTSVYQLTFEKTP
jgi:hypothetical protein